MTVYQELQLSSAGSKNLIRRSENKEEKKRHIFIYNAKVYLVVAFCFAVVTAFSLLFGSANSIAGVVVLLALLVLRQADFGRARSTTTPAMLLAEPNSRLKAVTTAKQNATTRYTFAL